MLHSLLLRWLFRCRYGSCFSCWLKIFCIILNRLLMLVPCVFLKVCESRPLSSPLLVTKGSSVLRLLCKLLFLLLEVAGNLPDLERLSHGFSLWVQGFPSIAPLFSSSPSSPCSLCFRHHSSRHSFQTEKYETKTT